MLSLQTRNSQAARERVSNKLRRRTYTHEPIDSANTQKKNRTQFLSIAFDNNHHNKKCLNFEFELLLQLLVLFACAHARDAVFARSHKYWYGGICSCSVSCLSVPTPVVSRVTHIELYTNEHESTKRNINYAILFDSLANTVFECKAHFFHLFAQVIESFFASINCTFQFCSISGLIETIKDFRTKIKKSSNFIDNF